LLRGAAARSPAEQVLAFVDELRSGLAAVSPPPYIEPVQSRFERDGVELYIDSYELPSTLLDRYESVDPAALRIGELFAEWSECPREISELFLARALLEVASETAEVHLDLTDLWDGTDLRGEPARLAAQLVRRVQLYDRAFAVLMEHQADVRRRATVGRVAELLRDLPSATTNEAKGRVLEDLVATIFDAAPGLVIASRRYDLGDQEIDLVIRNHVDDPFWTALQSPLILVECKNWSSPVGASELRDFETKLRDHPVARLGVFVAINGFSEEAAAVLQRAGRERYRLTLLTRADLASLIKEQLDVIEWLTRSISSLT
jgi:hypothetical protein